MNAVIRALCGAAIAAATLFGIGYVARAPLQRTTRARESSLLRLSWRFRSERVRECRTLSESELQSLPVHMRRPVVCEGGLVPYLLRVEIDGRMRTTERTTAAGARGDRPLYVFAEFTLPPGAHRLHVTFQQIRKTPDVENEDYPHVVSEGEEHGGPPGGRVPMRLIFDDSVTVAAGQVALLTYDAVAQRLVLRSSAHPNTGEGVK